jgi:hypothetical protein
MNLGAVFYSFEDAGGTSEKKAVDVEGKVGFKVVAGGDEAIESLAVVQCGGFENFGQFGFDFLGIQPLIQEIQSSI